MRGVTPITVSLHVRMQNAPQAYGPHPGSSGHGQGVAGLTPGQQGKTGDQGMLSGSHVRRRTRRRVCRSRFPCANGFTGLTNEGVTHRVLVVRSQTRYHLEAQLAAITGKLLASSRAIDRSRHSFLYELETNFGGVPKCFGL